MTLMGSSQAAESLRNAYLTSNSFSTPHVCIPCSYMAATLEIIEKNSPFPGILDLCVLCLSLLATHVCTSPPG